MQYYDIYAAKVYINDDSESSLGDKHPASSPVVGGAVFLDLAPAYRASATCSQTIGVHELIVKCCRAAFPLLHPLNRCEGGILCAAGPAQLKHWQTESTTETKLTIYNSRRAAQAAHAFTPPAAAAATSSACCCDCCGAACGCCCCCCWRLTTLKGTASGRRVSMG